MTEQAASRSANPAPRGPSNQVIFDYAEVEEFVAQYGLRASHVAEYFNCSHDVVTRRLADDPAFQGAFQRGISRFRRKVAERIERHAEKNPIVALAQANQPHILGWTNGKTEVSGTVEHIHRISPAEATWRERLNAGRGSSVIENTDHVEAGKIEEGDDGAQGAGAAGGQNLLP